MTEEERRRRLDEIIVNLGESVQNVAWDHMPADRDVRQLFHDANEALSFLCALRDRWEKKAS